MKPRENSWKGLQSCMRESNKIDEKVVQGSEHANEILTNVHAKFDTKLLPKWGGRNAKSPKKRYCDHLISFHIHNLIKNTIKMHSIDIVGQVRPRL